MGARRERSRAVELRAFGATFLTFSDYMRPPIRLAALMKLPVFHVFTHDSIGLGEDGPTHQPIEQLVALRAIPNLIVLRPADANEVREAYRVIFGLTDEPACLVLSRQKLPVFDRIRLCAGRGPGARRLCHGRRRKRRAAGDPDRQRQRGAALHRGARTPGAKGHCRPGRQHAELGAVRAAGRALSRHACCRRISKRALRSKWVR